MRNDAQDDIDELPKLTSERKEPRLDTSAVHTTLIDSHRNATPLTNTQNRSNKALGILSAVTIAIACSSTTFAWWSMQRMQLLEQQLIATQDSFSKINEDAAGRINAITGKVSATQNTVLSDNEALRKQLNTLQSSTVDTYKQQQISLTENSTHLSKLRAELASLAERSNNLSSQLEAQKTRALQQEKAVHAANTAQSELSKSLTAQQTQLQDLHSTLEANQQQLAQLKELDTRLTSVSTALSSLQKNTALNDDIARIQQELLILRSQVDNQPTPVSHTGPTIADFDAYRAQTNRTITTLQKQVLNLQKNTP